MTTNGRAHDTGVARGIAWLPDPPRYWSYSSLAAFGQCPLRFALERADYPDLWERHGYPTKPTIASLTGNVIHNALETIIRALVKAGSPSPTSAEFTTVMRGLGGYTTVLEDVAAALLDDMKGNPRLNQDSRTRLEIQLDERLERCRATVQTILSRLGDVPTTRTVSRAKLPSELAPTGRLSIGAHAETTLRCEHPRIMGRLDLLIVAAEGVSITDYKTGAASASHEDQLRFYAMLWHSDKTANPDGLPVTALAVAYPGESTAVSPPTPEEITRLIAETDNRVILADRQLVEADLKATPGEDCHNCQVRGLCNTYWATQATAPCSVEVGQWFDLDGTLGSVNAARSRWLTDRSGTTVLLRTPDAPLPEYADGQGVRLLGALRDQEPDTAVPIAILTSATEVLALAQSI